MQILSGHVSPETAYVVDDYPYGFRLRCTIRYWLEYKPGNGYRLCSQTTNPKKTAVLWNKPKASTYRSLGGVMYLNEGGHVTWHGLGYYDDTATCEQFLSQYGDTLPECGRKMLVVWFAKKKAYGAAVAAGLVKWTISTETANT